MMRYRRFVRWFTNLWHQTDGRMSRSDGWKLGCKGCLVSPRLAITRKLRLAGSVASQSLSRSSVNLGRMVEQDVGVNCVHGVTSIASWRRQYS